MNTFKEGQTVKFKHPLNEKEKELRFLVKELFPSTKYSREYILVELVCEDYLKPTFKFFANELVTI